MVISQRIGQILSQDQNFLKFHLIFFETTLFNARSTHVGTRQGHYPPTTPGSPVGLKGLKANLH